MLNLIVAFDKHASIHFDVAQVCPEHFHRFAQLTKGAIVIMGRQTWASLPDGYELLEDRTNLVLTTRTNAFSPLKHTRFVSPKDIDTYITTHKDVFVLGGASMFAMFASRAQRIYATHIEKVNAKGDVEQFPVRELEHFKIVAYDPMSCQTYRFVTYERSSKKHGEYAYLDLLSNVYTNGKQRVDRTTIGTQAVFGRQMRFDISESVPLLTTKQLGWKSVVRELLWFMKGHTDSKMLEAQGVNIWRANSTREFLDGRGLHNYQEGDIGPMYGFNWRHLGATYEGATADYTNKGHDQLAWLINSLKQDPYSRRHMITTFNPLVVDHGVLAPCHGIIAQFFVEDSQCGKTLSCHVYNRSQDTFLGMSWNIFSYAVMTHLIAKLVDMTPNELIISTGDTHIYTNHLEQSALQLKRTPMPFPVLVIHDRVKNKSLDDITIDDFDLIGYMSHPAIRAPMAV